MSVLCCQIPDFLIRLALIRSPELTETPLALLGSDERIWAASQIARESGVYTGMVPREARVRCPDLLFRPLDQSDSRARQDAFLAELARWELPVEEQGWGTGFLDLHTVATQPEQVKPLAAELGKRLRSALGLSLQPSLGWDSGKFTARAAAGCVMPGSMRMVGKADEKRFLSPLPITLLPLPEAALQQLHWLGIRTLGQYASLPVASVWQRFGAAGKVAQKWAQGKDNRPVCGNLQTPAQTIVVDIDPPSDQSGRVLAEVMHAFAPLLQRLGDNLTGCRRLRLNLRFVEGTMRTLEVTFVEPAAQPARVEAALAQKLHALIWPAELDQVEITLLESGELVAEQPALFALPTQQQAPLLEIAQEFSVRYGRCFFQGQIREVNHPVAERIFHLQPL
jgi:nucleotidyltransferase/DNA polymerase involved in DNA repair